MNRQLFCIYKDIGGKMKNSKGKLIIIEGCDGSGKETQTKKLYEKLCTEFENIKKVEYPNYKSESSALVKMYLRGDFGEKPEDVNPYAASTFYAVDRYASFKTSWKDFYNDGGIIIADRYTTANMVHQASKINNQVEKEAFLNWLWDLEFNKLGLPIPDGVIFLDMPPQYSTRLIEERKNKITGEGYKDIHEQDIEYLSKSYDNSCRIADKYGWTRIQCVKDQKIKSIEEIHSEIYKVTRNICKK